MKRNLLVTSLLFSLMLSALIIIESCNSNNNHHEAVTAATEFQFKEKLSGYGFFTGALKNLQPARGVTKYELSTPLFSDYAVKDRFIFLPAGKSIGYTSSGVLDFPDAAIIIKNFAYTDTAHQKNMLETRLLVKDPWDKKWKVMAYLWNADQTDAVKHITGASIPVTLLDDENNKLPVMYKVPNLNDCKRCHINNSTLTPIGPKARNLNFTLPAQKENQLMQWTALGLLKGLPALEKIDQLPGWKDDQHFSLEKRARAYLDVNCAHCHTKGGDAFNTGLFLEYEQTDKNHLGIMKTPVSAGNGAGGLNYDIVPGDATHSIMAYRMNHTEPNIAMPELGRSVNHKEGVQLITDWINGMKQ